MKLLPKQLQTTPHQVYAVNIEHPDHIEQLCEFLIQQQDRVFEIIINGQSAKFVSFGARKKFVEGFRRAGSILSGITITTHNQTPATPNQDLLKQNELLQAQLKAINLTQKIRLEAWQDTIEEYRVACEILTNKLNGRL